MARLLSAVLLLCATVAAAQAQTNASSQTATATFAGGCFWCVEADFDKVPGVISTTSGYTAGKVANPTYGQVSAGGTGHTEAVEVVYDPAKVSYEQLVTFFWRTIDPLVKDQQFCDHGDMYRTAIFYRNDQEKQVAESTKAQVEQQLKKPVFTEIAPAAPFYKAEDYHQDYYLKNPNRYKFYRWNCGRDQRLEAIWGKKDKSS
jgi:peptide-methionine (S)-S-oxide reductase